MGIFYYGLLSALETSFSAILGVGTKKMVTTIAKATTKVDIIKVSLIAELSAVFKMSAI